MMECIVLDDEEDCVMVVDSSESANIKKKNWSFKRKLILHVRKHRLLYDNKHKLFSNVAKRELVWQEIAKDLKVNVEECKDTWIELRYSYQRHARRLHKHFLYGHKKNCKRPAMYLESELMYLWRFIENRKTCNIPYQIEEPEPEPVVQLQLETNIPQISEEMECIEDPLLEVANKTVDDDLILVEEPVELIVIDEDDDNGKLEKQYKFTTTMKLLISQVKLYPELYDSENIAFKDYARKSYIWNAIATNLGDKATKLMKCWITMQTRYEWEICQGNDNSPASPPPTTELQTQFAFFKDYILNNPDTVYKQSYFLKSAWYEPIDYFKDIYNLIVRMKKNPDIVYVTDSMLKTPDKSKQYIAMWREIASLKGNTAGQCETTWLIMRHFYWLIMFMRQQNYQLTDKWYFETIITELYAISKNAQNSKLQELQALKQNKQEKSKKASKRVAPLDATAMGMTTISTIVSAPSATQMTPTIINNLQSLPSSNTTLTTESNSGPPSTFPKITGAISLAGSLQIKQISGPPSMPITQNMPPLTPLILNGMMTPHTAAAAASAPAFKLNSSAPFTLNSSAPSTLTSSAPFTLNSAAPSTLTSSAPPQMQFSFNLPNQTRVTSVAMPTLSPNIRPLAPTPPTLKNTAPATLSIRPKITVKPLPKMTMAPTLSTGNASAVPQTSQPPMTSAATHAPVACGGSTPMDTPQTIQSMSMKLTTQPVQNIEISNAISLLNPNEILIELIASQTGNHLVVHGPPLSSKYQLGMPIVEKFIREILAIPLLHNKHHNQPGLINSYWEHISKKFRLPLHICRACWNFLLENFSLFAQIAPLKELMKPFHTTLNVWKASLSLFKIFDEHCVSMGWLKYVPQLPDVVECIGSYPVLYQDVAKENGNKLSDMETLCAWRTISLRFPKIPDIQEIWAAIKNCFCQYMSDLEFGIDNKWPINWWRSLARMKFLVEAKYSVNEPFYYIISNKMLEEIEKCAMMEMKARYKTAKKSTETSVTQTENSNKTPKAENTSKTEQEPSVLPSFTASTLSAGKEIEMGALLTVVQKHPVLYSKADNVVKYEAWKKVAKELHMEVTDCLLALRLAAQKYFAYKKKDPVSRCRLNQVYYKKFEELLRSISSTKSTSHVGKLNIKTPFQLNQSFESVDVSNASDLIFPERFISDINMLSCSSNLVVKNWNYALGNLTGCVENHNQKLKDILDKYLHNSR